MYRTCTICGGIHHEDNMFKRYYKKNTKASKFRNSNAWITKRDKYLCQVCLKDSIYNYDDLQVHHIIPIDKNYELKLDESNLITLCSYHHKQAEQNKITKEYLYKLINIPRGVIIKNITIFPHPQPIYIHTIIGFP